MNCPRATYSTQTIRYRDCITGKIGAPTERKRKSIFQLMMIAGCMPFTATVNWLLHTPTLSLEAFLRYFTLYPILICIAICVRFAIANPIAESISKRFILPRLEGVKKAVSISFLNILIMGTVVAFVRTIVTSGNPAGICWETYLTSLPTSYITSFVFSYFVVSPFIKKLFSSTIEPRLRTGRIPWEQILQNVILKQADKLGSSANAIWQTRLQLKAA